MAIKFETINFEDKMEGLREKWGEMKLEVMADDKSSKEFICKVVKIAGPGQRVDVPHNAAFILPVIEENRDGRVNLGMIFYGNKPECISSLLKIPEGARWVQCYSRSDPRKIAFYRPIDEIPGYEYIKGNE